jgi:hypothetical protein
MLGYFTKKNWNCCTFNAISKDNSAVSCVMAEHKNFDSVKLWWVELIITYYFNIYNWVSFLEQSTKWLCKTRVNWLSAKNNKFDLRRATQNKQKEFHINVENSTWVKFSVLDIPRPVRARLERCTPRSTRKFQMCSSTTRAVTSAGCLVDNHGWNTTLTSILTREEY